MCRMDNILTLQNLRTELYTPEGIVHAVRNVNLSVRKSEIHGIVGESGCGKTITAKSILQLNDKKRTVYSGKVELDGTIDLLNLREKELRRIRGKKISMVFQDPMTSLNPVISIGQQISESLTAHNRLPKREAEQETMRLLEKVGIYPPEKRIRQYPFELSGGMLQRVAIAGAIACGPELLIADEPTTALDVTIQAQILELLKTLQKSSGLSVLLITHNLSVVAELCDRVSVMYAGEIVESGKADDVFNDPKHPYTLALLRSMPKSGGARGKMSTIPGSPPSLKKELAACAFSERCDYAQEKCKTSRLLKSFPNGHTTLCCRGGEIQNESEASKGVVAGQ